MDVFRSLCWYDKRNPNYIEQDADDEQIARIGCSCENCFYGRDALAMEILRLREAGIGYSQQTVDALTRERDALKADAERYRWLRRDPVAGSLYVTSDDDPSIWIRGDDLDAAIDAARGKE